MYTSLDEIIKSLLVQLELAGEHSYLRFFELARIGLKELSFDTARHIKTSLLTVNSATNSASLPEDYIGYTKIGVYNSDGTISYLAKLDTLYKGAITPSGATNTSTDTDPPVWIDGAGKQYGKGGGQNSHGYYRLNEIAGTIELSSSVSASQLVVEYITDGLDNVDGSSNVQIHSFLAEALKTYIYWAHIKYKRDFTATDKEIAKKDFYNQKRLARARVQGMTKDEALVQSRKHQRQSPKY
jgi:hypothetical protein